MLLETVNSELWGGYPLTTNNTPLNINGKGIQVGRFVPTCPESIQQATTPRDHQSTAWPYGSILTTSGAEIIELTFFFSSEKDLELRLTIPVWFLSFHSYLKLLQQYQCTLFLQKLSHTNSVQIKSEQCFLMRWVVYIIGRVHM